MYHVSLQIDGQWQPVARWFDRLEGATQWGQDVLAQGQALEITGFRVQDETDRVVCAVEGRP